MGRLSKLEYYTSVLTSVLVAELAFPDLGIAAFAGAALTAITTFVALIAIIMWIKSGTDRHL